MLGHQFADAQIAICLDAITDDRIRGGEGGLNLLQMAKQRCLAIDVKRCAVMFRECGNGDVLAEQSAVAVDEVVMMRHVEVGNGGCCCSCQTVIRPDASGLPFFAALR